MKIVCYATYKPIVDLVGIISTVLSSFCSSFYGSAILGELLLSRFCVIFLLVSEFVICSCLQQVNCDMVLKGHVSISLHGSVRRFAWCLPLRPLLFSETFKYGKNYFLLLSWNVSDIVALNRFLILEKANLEQNAL